MYKNKLISTLIVILSLVFVTPVDAQNPRPLWRGDAYVGGDFDVLGTNGATAESYSATTTISAATFVAGASDVQINIPLSGSGLDDYGLIYDDAVGDIALRPIPAGTVAAIGDITDVSASNKVADDLLQWSGSQWVSTRIESILDLLDSINNVDTSGKGDGDVLYWNAGSSIWGATPQSSGGGSVAALSDIGDVTLTGTSDNDYLQYDSGTSAWINQSFTQALNDLSDVDAAAPANDEVLTWNNTSSKWEPAAGGGGGGGARSRTISVAASDAMNPSEYDYQCDGTADNAEINAALASLNDVTGGTVILSEGHFYIAATVELATNSLSLVGNGPKATTLIRTWESTSGREGVVSVATYAGTDVTDSIVRDLGIDGESTTYTDFDCAGLVADEFDRCYFTRLYVTDCAGEGFYFDDASVDQDMNSVFSDSYVDTCLEGVEVASSDRFQMNGITSRDNTQEGFVLSSPDNISVVGCIAYSNGDEGFSASGGTTQTYDNCQAVSNGQAGFDIAATQSTLTNCLASGNSQYGFNISTDYIAVVGCYAYNNTLEGIFADISAGRTLISSNYTYSNGDHGIYVWNAADGCHIVGNYTFDNGESGIFVDSADDISIIGNYISQNTEYGIELGNSSGSVDNAIIASNYFDDPTDHPIRIEYCFDIWIKENTFRANDAGESVEIVSIDDYGGAQSERIYMTGNNFIGTWAGDYAFEGGQTVAPIRLMTLTTDAGAEAEIIIASSSASAKVGFATSDATTITNVITVASGSTTDPIADAWSIWSLRRFKENIEPVTTESVEYADAESFIMDAPMITFDWKPSFGTPVFEDYKPLYDSNNLIASATEQYNADRAAYEIWKQNPNRKNQVGFDVDATDFPDRLAAYDEGGNKVGLNFTQAFMRAVLLLRKAANRIDALEAENESLSSRIKALEDAVFKR